MNILKFFHKLLGRTVNEQTEPPAEVISIEEYQARLDAILPEPCGVVAPVEAAKDEPVVAAEEPVSQPVDLPELPGPIEADGFVTIYPPVDRTPEPVIESLPDGQEFKPAYEGKEELPRTTGQRYDSPFYKPGQGTNKRQPPYRSDRRDH